MFNHRFQLRSSLFVLCLTSLFVAAQTDCHAQKPGIKVEIKSKSESESKSKSESESKSKSESESKSKSESESESKTKSEDEKATFKTYDFYKIPKIPYNVRKTRWGMSPEQVKRSEAWKFSRKDENKKDGSIHLTYVGYLLDHQCLLNYSFKNNRLTNVGYVFNHDVQEKLKLLLTNKYGKSKRLGNYDSWTVHDGKTSIALVRQKGAIFLMYSDKKNEDRENLAKTRKHIREADSAF